MLLGVADTIVGAGFGAEGGAILVLRSASREGTPKPARVFAVTRTLFGTGRARGREGPFATAAFYRLLPKERWARWVKAICVGSSTWRCKRFHACFD